MPSSSKYALAYSLRKAGRMARKANILLVDDDRSVRESLGQALQGENFQVVSASSGPEALSKIEHNHIDVALLDLNLGQESGWDTFQRLNGLPVIVMSARPECFAHASAPEAAALMEKPLDMAVLFKTLQDLLAAVTAPNNHQAKDGATEGK
jgi:two-component system, NtrC family, response regulator GlrR